MYYTYIIESIPYPNKRYIGHTSDLKQRLEEHNQGKCEATKKHGPWKIKAYIAFENLEKAQQFERYLKSGAGHAFVKRHRRRSDTDSLVRIRETPIPSIENVRLVP